MKDRLESLGSWLSTEIASEWDYDYKKLNHRTPVKLYHYTTTDGVMGILQNRTLFASNALFLNDSSELHYGRKLICAALEQSTVFNEFQTVLYQGFGFSENDLIRRIICETDSVPVNDVYVSCFTTESDLLSQWRGYANNAGIRIGFNREKLTDVLEHVYLAEVNYNRKSQIAQIEQMTSILLDYVINKEGKDLPSKDKELLPKAIASLLLSSISTFKDDAFKEEKEYRLIHDQKKSLNINFRNNGKFIVPYVMLTAKNDQLLPITDIMVSQSPYCEKMKQGIELLLNANGYKNIKVSISKIPYIP